MKKMTEQLAPTDLLHQTIDEPNWRMIVPVTLSLVVLLIIASWQLDPVRFRQKLAELVLQLGLIVIVGALVKYFTDVMHNRRVVAEEARDKAQIAGQQDHEKRREFLRRMTAAHVKTAHGRLLIRTHNSARTYTEQLRELMLVVPQLEELTEELVSARDLFGNNSHEIVEGVKLITAYLKSGVNEYVRFHSEVDVAGKAGKPLNQIVDELGMVWVRNFIAGPDFPDQYSDALRMSKRSMRETVFGAEVVGIRSERQQQSRDVS